MRAVVIAAVLAAGAAQAEEAIPPQVIRETAGANAGAVILPLALLALVLFAANAND